jgi:hypothetical protein
MQSSASPTANINPVSQDPRLCSDQSSSSHLISIKGRKKTISKCTAEGKIDETTKTKLRSTSLSVIQGTRHKYNRYVGNTLLLCASNLSQQSRNQEASARAAEFERFMDKVVQTL